MPRSTNSKLKKVIVDYNKLNETILNLLVEKYPFGYDYEDIIVFKNAKNESIKCVEVSDGKTLFMVKISSKLEQEMERYDLDDDFYESDDPYGLNF